VCTNLVCAGYVVTDGDMQDELDSMMAGGPRWGGTPDEVAAQAVVLITILPGSQEQHDVMLITRSARGPASSA
jgi:hypothetical protein